MEKSPTQTELNNINSNKSQATVLQKSATAKKPLNKFNLIIIAIIVILGAFGLIIIKDNYSKTLINNNIRQSQMPNHTPANISQAINAQNGWRIYKNLKYGYQISYPYNWTISKKEDEATNSAQAILISKENPQDPYFLNKQPDDSVFIETLAIPVKYTFEQWWMDHLEKLKNIYKNLDSSAIKFPRDNIQLDVSDKNNNLIYKTNILWEENFVYLITIDNKTPIDSNSDAYKILTSLIPQPNKKLLNWKKYDQNSDYSIEIPGLSTVRESPSSGLTISDSYEGKFIHCGCGWNISIKILPNYQQLSIPDWYNKNTKNYDEQDKATAGKLSNLTRVGKYDGYFLNTFGFDKNIITKYIGKGNKIYAIQYWDNSLANLPEDGWQKLIYNKIINSFTFK